MVFNTTFNNISAHPSGLGLWCLTPLSTIFQLILMSCLLIKEVNYLFYHGKGAKGPQILLFHIFGKLMQNIYLASNFYEVFPLN